MKKRTFFATLLLFLLFFFTMLLAVSVILLRDKISIAREKALADHYVIASALFSDMQSLSARSMDVLDSVGERMAVYSRSFGNRKNLLAVSHKNRWIYQNEKELSEDVKNFPAEKIEDARQIVTVKGTKRSMIYVYGHLPEPFLEYGLLYGSDLNGILSSWNDMKNLLFLAGAAVAFLLSLCLLKLLNSVFEPLVQISAVSATIADGNYRERLSVKGKDEIADMADSFNRMAGQVERQIALLQEAAVQKQQFIDNFAHELKTPLTAVYGYAEYMQKASLSEEEHYECTQFIMSECRRLQDMSYQLLEMAEMRKSSMEACFLEELFAQSKRMMQVKADEKQIGLSYHCDAGYIRENRQLLLSLINNLADNAIKAGKEGGEVCVLACQKEGGTMMEVKDDGIGMDEETLCHITEAFYRADKARSRAAGGAGLGLSICEKIAKLHHAELSFVSQPGEGTVAKVFFPKNIENFTDL